ncbi:TPA: hypothetical protein ACIFD1_003343 [Acinetobacter baumannii]
MIDLNKEREAFLVYLRTKGVIKVGWNSLGVLTNLVREAGCTLGYNDIELMQEVWMEKAKAQGVPENTEDWYLNEDEGLWLDHDGIDGTLCELGIGEVKPVKHKEYLITQSNTWYAARVWNSDDDHIAWKLFESEESALEAANYCKQMYEASESGAANE